MEALIISPDKLRALLIGEPPRAEDVEQPFLSVQYLYGLARAGRPEANRLMAAIRQRADQAPERIVRG